MFDRGPLAAALPDNRPHSQWRSRRGAADRLRRMAAEASPRSRALEAGLGSRGRVRSRLGQRRRRVETHRNRRGRASRARREAGEAAPGGSSAWCRVWARTIWCIALISGGGSSLLDACRRRGSRLRTSRRSTAALLRSGAPIGEMNCVRKHLSAIKGGRLAAAACPGPASLPCVISDVPGDDPSAIASGPTVADPTTFADARAILARYGITEPSGVTRTPGARRRTRRPSPATLRLARSRDDHDRDAAHVARSGSACGTQDAGVTPLILGDATRGRSARGRASDGRDRAACSAARAARATAVRPGTPEARRP